MASPRVTSTPCACNAPVAAASAAGVASDSAHGQLTDDIWLYGGSESSIMETINKGRSANMVAAGVSVMPAHKDLLDDAKIHLLAAYVYSLSQPEKK